MKNKEKLRTVRLRQREIKLIDEYLRLNPAIESFSSLIRIALLDFISKAGSIPLKPIVVEKEKKRPSFLWDYDLNEGQLREILAGSAKKRYWLVARILEHARFDEVWDYLTPEEIARDLPNLRMPKKIKDHWEYALKLWRAK